MKKLMFVSLLIGLCSLVSHAATISGKWSAPNAGYFDLRGILANYTITSATAEFSISTVWPAPTTTWTEPENGAWFEEHQTCNIDFFANSSANINIAGKSLVIYSNQYWSSNTRMEIKNNVGMIGCSRRFIYYVTTRHGYAGDKSGTIGIPSDIFGAINDGVLNFTVDGMQDANIGPECSLYVTLVPKTVAIQPVQPKSYPHIFNAPNPFSPARGTQIVFDMPADGSAELKIFTEMGDMCWHRSLDGLPAGRNQVAYNGRDDNARALYNGTYVCEITKKYSGKESTDRCRLLITK